MPKGRIKILLIEDEPEDVILFRKVLAAESDLIIADESTLDAGIERCGNEFFDLVMLDLSLPDSRGLETLTRFREEVESGPAVILLTGLDDRELALRAVQAGAQDFVVKGVLAPEMLVSAIRHSLERHRMSQKLMAANDRVRYLATHCPLTGLPNRFLLMDRLENAIASSARSGVGLAVLFIDLDEFKPINDTYGHEAGDLVLQAVGERIRGATRSSDTVSRLGGDEFAILLRGTTEAADIERVSSKIWNALAAPIDVGVAQVIVETSIGIALHPADGATGERLLRNADAAMYSAKRRKERYRFCSEAQGSGARYRTDLENDLALAIERDGFELHLQPQVEGREGWTVGFETLIRWHREGVGWLSPLDFIPYAEQCGLIGEIGSWVIRKAAVLRAEWRRGGWMQGRISINVTRAELENRGYAVRLLEALTDAGLSGEDFAIELKESCLDRAAGNAGTVFGALSDLQSAGVAVALDDFGAGRTRLGELASFPIDELKLDMRLVQGAPEDTHCAKTLRAMIHLAHDLDFGLIAEGVETEAQRAFLLDNGCLRMQGHLFAQAMPPDAACGLLGKALGPAG